MTNHFSVAAYSYFRVNNKHDAKRTFLKSSISQPLFTYGPQFTLDTVRTRLALADPATLEHAKLSLVEVAGRLQYDVCALNDFRKANVRISPMPRSDYTLAILSRIAKKVTPETEILWQEVCEKTGSFEKNVTITAPDDELFQLYRQYLRRYVGTFNTKGMSVGELLHKHIALTGLDQKGWTVKFTANTESARTNHRTKTIWIGEGYTPRMIRAKKRIVLHEVYGHALRGPQLSYVEAEGFAIVLEQLVGTLFKYRRAYRYLAVGLGWGVLGRPMTFREVFEILWRLMLIGSGYSKLQAREYAFDEVTRAFRGGRPDIAGAVFLKDSAYFDGNIAMWDSLISKKLSYNEFIDIIEGRRALLT